MPKKKSIETSAREYIEELEEVEQFLDRAKNNKSLTKKDTTWIYEYGLIRMYRGFEELMLDCLVGAVNNDMDSISNKTGILFPKHLSKEVCEFLIIGIGYFDFRGRSGLINKLTDFLPRKHFLVTCVKDNTYKDTLDILVVFRNYAVHSSKVARKKALEVTGRERLGAAGTWLKIDNRLEDLIEKLKDFAKEIHDSAPY